MITAYLESGLLKFKVSCGAQQIRFSDPRRVDTGNRQNIDISLTVEANGGTLGKKCVTVIHLNETHTMRGEQEVDDQVPERPRMIYFGQMPRTDGSGRDKEIPQEGFQGCMNQFQVWKIRLTRCKAVCNR